ncbi:amino acid adenylation domain-containing protein [Paenibacillus vini]|nr:amino acid adenylation domain-containing protein [Paenibacillus vini]MDN4066697.1 amino acid adenylation domain-containing protein [Paenibacillus vini]
MRNTIDLVTYLTSLNVRLSVSGDSLKCDAPHGVLTPELRDNIAKCKAEILSILRTNTTLPVLKQDMQARYERFPLTDIQQAYWLGRNDAFEIGGVSTHVYMELIAPSVNLGRLNAAWNKLVKRHEMLRVVILSDGEQQILENTPDYVIELTDLSTMPEEGSRSELKKRQDQFSHMVLPLDQWPMFHIEATRLHEHETRIHINFDLLIADLSSLLRIFEEWNAYYFDLDHELPNLNVSFRDYVLAERSIQGKELYNQSKDYWLSRLETLPAAPSLPLVKNPVQVEKPRFQRRRMKMAADEWNKIKDMGQKKGLTPTNVVLTAFSTILGMWSKKAHYTLNITLFNRLPIHEQINEIIGDFTTTIPFEVDVSNRESFSQTAFRIQQQLWRDLDYRYFSGVQVMRELSRKRGSRNTALFPIVFTSTLGLNSLGQDITVLDKLGEEDYGISQTPQVWLDHIVLERNGCLELNWDAVEELFPTGMLDSMFECYCSLMKSLLIEETWSELELEILPETEQVERRRANRTESLLSEDLLHAPFLRQAQLQPEKKAVITSEKTLTYQDLVQWASRIGHWLQTQGARPNQLVGILMEKGWEQVVAVLGTLISGAAYLPIDPKLPTERIQQLLVHANLELLLTQSKWEHHTAYSNQLQWLNVDELQVEGDEISLLMPRQCPEDLAYMIYTSGTTGIPKGVMIEHRGAINTILDINERLKITKNDCVIALSSLSFDLSVYDIFGTLAAGGTIVIPDADKTKDPSHWANLLREYRVTVWNSVPALMNMLAEYMAFHEHQLPQFLEKVMLSGDWIPLSLPKKIRQIWGNAEIYSLGGATEASIWSIAYLISDVEEDWMSIPYGKPLQNQRFHVLDSKQNPCPVWVPGELYIGGVGLARGYWSDAEKTEKSFIIHPITKERLYRTGDYGRYLPDGNIEFIGREDTQVKLNGFRIELGEIEATLMQHEYVEKAVVVVENRNGTPLLAAYIEMKKLDLERLSLKLDHRALRLTYPDEVEYLLPDQVFHTDKDAYLKRQSYKQFISAPLETRTLGKWLRCLSAYQPEYQVLPKYRYPSAGGLYPVQTYFSVKPGGVNGVEAGLYYYHPLKHRLVQIQVGHTLPDELFGFKHKQIVQQAAFYIFLVGKMDAIEPIYGEYSRDFSMMEAGYMGQLLMEEGTDNGIGLCPMGHLGGIEKYRDLFQFDDNHIFLHCFIGGSISPEQTKRWGSVTDAPKSEDQVNSLTEFLMQKLPYYMVPSLFNILDSIPLTVNGKVDREQLSSIQGKNVGLFREIALPRTETEKKLIDILQEIFQIREIGINQTFFELGGDSLLAVRLLSRIQEIFQLELSLRVLFEKKTILDLAKYIDVLEGAIEFSGTEAVEEGAL